jgi:hypothetical protein
MAVIQNAFTTKVAKGNREQLEAAIYRIDPEETPIYTLSGSKARSVGGISFDFQNERLPDRGNAPQVEAYKNENAAPTPTARLYGTTMLLKRDATVSGDQEEADAAGKPEGEMAHQMALAAAALKIDFDEYFSRAQPRRDDDGVNGAVTEGLEHALKTNVSRGVGGASAADAYGTVTAGTARPLTEELFDDVLQAAWENGAKCDWALVGGHQKRVISKFVGRQNGRFETGINEIAIGGVTLLMSDFGDIKIKTGRNHNKSSVLILDPEYLKKVTFRGFKTYTMGVEGDATTKVIQARLGLQVSNERAHALIADLTTSF